MEGTTLPVVKIDQFEGPFDLLIELAREHKIDLSEVSLSTITDSFFVYLKKAAVPTSLQADFLVVASTLLLLKVHQLVPEFKASEEEEITALTDRVRIYELYRRHALSLREHWARAMLLPGPERLAVAAPVPFPAVRAPDLAAQYRTALSRIQPPIQPQRHLRKHYRTLEECVSLLADRIQKYRQLTFQKEVRGESSQVAALSFLALLEMARARHVRLQQAEPFAALTIELHA